MEIDIKVSGNKQSLSQPDWQCVVRAANMFTEHGYIVKIIWDAKITKATEDAA